MSCDSETASTTPPRAASSAAWRHAACALALLSTAQRTDLNTETASTGRLVLSTGCAPQCVESTTCAVIAPWPTRADRTYPRRGSYPYDQDVRNRRECPCGPDRMSSHREAHIRPDVRAEGSDGPSQIRAWGAPTPIVVARPHLLAPPRQPS